MSPVMPRVALVDQVGGWESHGSPKGGPGEQRRHFPFHKSIGCDRGAPLGEVVVGNLLIKCTQLGSPSWKSLGSKGGF